MINDIGDFFVAFFESIFGAFVEGILIPIVGQLATAFGLGGAA